MKIFELIKVLLKLDPELEVVYCDGNAMNRVNRIESALPTHVDDHGRLACDRRPYNAVELN
jgi:hypothetical protein